MDQPAATGKADYDCVKPHEFIPRTEREVVRLREKLLLIIAIIMHLMNTTAPAPSGGTGRFFSQQALGGVLAGGCREPPEWAARCRQEEAAEAALEALDALLTSAVPLAAILPWQPSSE